MLNQEFNTWQQDYNAKIRRWVPHYDTLVKGMTQWSGDHPPATILDLGCGNGNTVGLLLKQYPEANYTLVDASEDMISACQFRFRQRSNIHYEQSYFQDLDFTTDTFDLVVAGLAFHHLKGPEKQAIFEQVYRWLRPGGELLASDLYASKQWPDYEGQVMQPWAAFAKKAGTPASEWEAMLVHHAQYDFPDSYEKQQHWLQKAGFTEVEINWVDGFWGTLRAKK